MPLADQRFWRARRIPSAACVELQQTDRKRADYIDFRENGRITAVESAALARDELVKQGNVTGHEVRVWALYSATTDAEQVKTTLRARFDELIVDDAQDCSLTDLAILEELRRAGLPLVLVGDLDQAIYEFRDARPEQVRGAARRVLLMQEFFPPSIPNSRR